MDTVLSIVLTSLSISGIVIGALFALLKKYFLDLDTYNNDKMILEETHRVEVADLKAYTDSVKVSEDKLFEKFDEMLQKIREEKASNSDLVESKNRIEKLEDRLTNLTSAMEKQTYRLDVLIDSRNDLVQTFKDLRIELNDYLKNVKDDISEVKKTNNKMQLDLQAVKSRLGVMGE